MLFTWRLRDAFRFQWTHAIQIDFHRRRPTVIDTHKCRVEGTPTELTANLTQLPFELINWTIRVYCYYVRDPIYVSATSRAEAFFL